MKCWLALLTVHTLAVASPVVKRSDDTNPLEAVVSQLSSDHLSLQAKVDALSNLLGRLNVRVGFYTSIQRERTVAHSPTNIVFDAVQYNEGSGYDSTSGFFTAPVAGMYSFFIKSEVDPGHNVGMRVVKEGHQVLYIYGYDHDSYQTPSGQVVMHMNKGERAWVQTQYDNVQLKALTRFGGFLVMPDA